jgi:hypothetical protein
MQGIANMGVDTKPKTVLHYLNWCMINTSSKIHLERPVKFTATTVHDAPSLGKWLESGLA